MSNLTTCRGPAVVIDRLPAKIDTWTPAYLTGHLARQPYRDRAPGVTRYNISAWLVEVAWVTTLAELGLDDPTEATQLYHRAGQIARDAGPVKPNSEADQTTRLVRQFVDGSLSRDDLLAAAREQAIDATIADQQRQRVSALLSAAAAQFQQRARTALVEAGDSLLTLLQDKADSILSDALSRGADVEKLDRQWRKLHDLAHRLRGPILSTIDARMTEHEMARPDLAHDWRLNRAETVRERAREEHSSHVLIELAPDKSAPKLTVDLLARYADEWKPGLYSAAQVLTHSKEWNQ